MGPVLYFAYGSNLNRRQMRKRCASARVEARAVLPNHALAFGGFSHRWGGAVATVLPVRGAHVEGLLYSLDPSELRSLDRHEGHPFVYKRVAMFVKDPRGRRRCAQVYVQAAVPFAEAAPAPCYARVIRRAYRRLGFDAASLKAAEGAS
jgi:gamma-glutamylcyclotransferase